jgi:ATP-dependent Clp protease, protease subunit
MSNIRDAIGEIHNYGIDVKNREIYLHSAKDGGEDDPGVDYRMAINFVKNIRHLDSLSNEEIRINMQSIGGSWSAGTSIYDAIASCKSYVTIVVYGQAESMSGIILQSADNRLMSPSSYFMTHFGSTDCSGDYQSSQNWAELDKYNLELMLNIFASKCVNGKFFQERGYNLSKTKSYIKRKMKNGDWYLSSQDAVYYGFADGIYENG